MLRELPATHFRLRQTVTPDGDSERTHLAAPRAVDLANDRAAHDWAWGINCLHPASPEIKQVRRST